MTMCCMRSRQPWRNAQRCERLRTVLREPQLRPTKDRRSRDKQPYHSNAYGDKGSGELMARNHRPSIVYSDPQEGNQYRVPRPHFWYLLKPKIANNAMRNAFIVALANSMCCAVTKSSPSETLNVRMSFREYRAGLGGNRAASQGWLELPTLMTNRTKRIPPTMNGTAPAIITNTTPIRRFFGKELAEAVIFPPWTSYTRIIFGLAAGQRNCRSLVDLQGLFRLPSPLSPHNPHRRKIFRHRQQPNCYRPPSSRPTDVLISPRPKSPQASPVSDSYCCGCKTSPNTVMPSNFNVSMQSESIE